MIRIPQNTNETYEIKDTEVAERILLDLENTETTKNVV